MESSQRSPGDRISIIEDAIRKAKQEKTGAAFYYILWGTVLSLFAFMSYLALSLPSPGVQHLHSFAWIVFPLGGLLSFLKTRKDDQTEKVKPMNERLYLIVWGGVSLCLGTLTVFGMLAGQIHFLLPTVLIIFGFASFLTGGITRFRPSLIGGALCIICAGITMVLPLALQFLIGAIAMLFSNVIPGILMNKMQAVDV